MSIDKYLHLNYIYNTGLVWQNFFNNSKETGKPYYKFNTNYQCVNTCVSEDSQMYFWQPNIEIFHFKITYDKTVYNFR